ncbi:response regulator [Methyloversatilis thermotolerans]|uniref:response regulator n=1 Tax=Methyloversatilis thermotolerans TaxID=1346290 RepID=UPI000377ECC9|nr:response regulator transcription factor [Methyloversatilis thermotolerans]
MASLLLVDDHVLVREGLAQTIARACPDWTLIEASDAAQALSILDAGADIDLVMTDLMLPGMNGFSLLATLRERDPSLPVIVVSALGDRATVARALRQGASGFVSKSDSGEQLVRALRAVLDGDIYMPSDKRPQAAGNHGAAASLHSLPDDFGLTQAQQRVLDLLGQGRSNREIAESLGLAEGTVKVHLSRIFKAMKVGSRAQALILLSQRRARK